HRGWLKPSIPNALQEFISVFPQPWQRCLDGHSVDSRRAVIAFDLLVSFVQVIPVQYSLQQVLCTVSFSTFPRSGTPRSRILFVFHTIPLRAALSVFCFQRTGSPSCMYSRLTIVRPFPKKKKNSVLWPLLTSHSKLYSVFRMAYSTSV